VQKKKKEKKEKGQKMQIGKAFVAFFCASVYIGKEKRKGKRQTILLRALMGQKKREGERKGAPHLIFFRSNGEEKKARKLQISNSLNRFGAYTECKAMATERGERRGGGLLTINLDKI